MSLFSTPSLGLIAFALFAAFAALVALLYFNVRIQSVSRLWLGFRVYDWNADLQMPLHSRSYRIALYLTMKSLPRETCPPRITAPAASSPSTSHATRAA